MLKQPDSAGLCALVGAFGSPPDLLLAGINHELNIG
jgi:hypothetical protein